MTARISITPEAVAHLHQDLDGKLLRIAYTTGCGGSGYRLASADAPEAEDLVLQLDGMRVAMDDMAAKNLDGAVIDYRPDEDGYVLDHPEAVTAVWCG